MVPRRGSKSADIYQEVRCGFSPESSVVVLLLDCSREFYKAVVGYTDALRVGVQCDPCFHCKKEPGALDNLDHSSSRAMRAINPDRFRRAICQRHF